MRHTLTAVFYDRGDAQHALNKLLAAGFLRADATLSLIAPAGQGATMREGGHGLGLLARQLFAHLPATRSAAQRANDTGPHPGRHLLTLTTASEPEADRAIGLIGGLVFADGHPVWPIARSANTTRRFYRPGTEPGALQNYAHVGSHYFGTRDADAFFPVGTTFRAASFSTSPWEHIEDGADNADGPGAQAPPAWRFADEIAAERHDNDRNREHVSEPARVNKARDSFQSRMRHWTALAAGRQANWVARHLGELPPWEKFKDALLHGWGKIRLGNEDEEGADPARDAAGTDSDDPSPAYRYGDEMAHSGQFSGLRWEDAENALHDAWDRRYGERGFASWDENKAAVRQGWERTRPLPGASAR